jgi:hypothetical protein
MGMQQFFLGDPPAKFTVSVTWSVNLVNVVFLAVRYVYALSLFRAKRSYLGTLPDQCRKLHHLSC